MDSTSVPQYIPPADEVAGKASPAGHHEPEEAQPVEVAGYVYMGDASTLTPCSLGEHPKPIAGPNVALYLFGHVRDAETKDVVAVDVRVRQGDYRRVLTMPVSVIRATQAADPWHKHTGLSLTPAQARGASTWLSAAIATNVGRRTRFEVQRPTWTGDRLQLPSSYAKSGCTEERARECWRRAIGIARDYPKLAFTFGAYVASPLLERLGLPGGGVNLLDDSTTGKTTSGRGGSAIWGKPSPVGNDPSWHGTLGSKTDELAESGGMPLFWDDANNTAESEVTLGKLVMQIAQGIEKGRLNQHAEQRDKRTWRLIVVSTSETSLLTKGTVGAAARWVEVHGPFMPDKKTAEEVDALTREAYGWPGRLLTAEDWKLPELPALRDTGSAVANRTAKLVAACAAGFDALAQVFGVEVSAREIQEIGQSVLDEVAEGMASQGGSSTDRMRTAIDNDYVLNPPLFPPLAADGQLGGYGSSRPLRGFTKDGQLWYFATRAQELAEELKLDLTAAMQGLHKAGDIIKTEGNGRLQVRTPRIGGKQIRAYVFDLAEVESSEVDSETAQDLDRLAAELLSPHKVAA